MSRPVKRVLLTLVALVLVVAAVLGAGVAQMFLGLRPVEDGRTINDVRIVVDGFSAIGVVPTGPGEVAIIDAGMDTTGAALLAELSRRGLQASAVKAVLLTHGHADHIGAIAVLPGAEVMALDAEVALIEGRASPASPMGRVMPVSPTGVSVTRTLQDGETVAVGDASIAVFAAPGHTSGSAVYLVNGVLFTGDSAQITSDGSIRPAPWLVSDDRALNRASLISLERRLASSGVPVTAIVPAHSGPADGLGALTGFARGAE